jgi:arylsulfatase B
MVTQFDEHVGQVVDAMTDAGYWNNGLVVFSSDNGGPIYNNGAPGASNWPLRAGKASNFDGGIRVPSFISGGAVPLRARGTQRDGLVTLWDWYASSSNIMYGHTYISYIIAQHPVMSSDHPTCVITLL